MSDPLLRLAELLGALAERVAALDLRLAEGVDRVVAAVVALDARLKRGGERAAKAERSIGDKLDALPTADGMRVLLDELRADAARRYEAEVALLSRLQASVDAIGDRVGALEARPAPASWADLVAKHPTLSGALVTLILALAAYLGSLAPRRIDEPVTPPTAILPGAGSRLLDRRLASGGEG